MQEVKLGYYFARVLNSDRITVVGCWGDRIEKTVKEDVEVLEKVPATILSCKSKILNLQRIMENER